MSYSPQAAGICDEAGHVHPFRTPTTACDYLLRSLRDGRMHNPETTFPVARLMRTAALCDAIASMPINRGVSAINLLRGSAGWVFVDGTPISGIR